MVVFGYFYGQWQAGGALRVLAVGRGSKTLSVIDVIVDNGTRKPVKSVYYAEADGCQTRASDPPLEYAAGYDVRNYGMKDARIFNGSENVSVRGSQVLADRYLTENGLILIYVNDSFFVPVKKEQYLAREAGMGGKIGKQYELFES